MKFSLLSIGILIFSGYYYVFMDGKKHIDPITFIIFLIVIVLSGIFLSGFGKKNA